MKWCTLTVVAGAVLAASVSVADPAPIAAKPFTRIAAAKAAIDGWRAQLCGPTALACSDDPEQLALYQAPGDPPDAAWAILAKGPVLARLRRSAGDAGWTVDRRWSFVTYVSSRMKGFDANNPPSIYPALYPVGAGTWAVALVNHVFEMYSGGGASFDIADFVMLAGSPSPVYEGVPFWCSKMVRACFTEEEYRRGGNCHDLYEGFLTLSYGPSRSADRYTWTAVWHERDQMNGMPKPRADTMEQTVRLSLVPGDMSRAFRPESFCNGGPVAADP
jgi:hypothetical protein